MPTKLRLYDLEPAKVAMGALIQLRAEVERKTLAVAAVPPLAEGPVPPAAGAPVYEVVRRIAEYACGGVEYDRGVEGALIDLGAWFSPLELEQPEPSTPLAMVVAGAKARVRLETGQHLTIPELAVLTGLDRHHVTRLASESKIPSAYRSTDNRHKPWKFRPSKALRAWIDSYQPTQEAAPYGTATSA